ncbi:pentapeptide repeat-containing protein [Rhizomonospora bruguierae]|uniref:pentapeptide repeat-containing protein n=1 Tax=Rhizomonospora bruguierae TaxID=1581705 RepID=UPI001BCEA659|nr:pentapeptide repeat-containing protein [Micromonospora sp. NBRC 107566]
MTSPTHGHVNLLDLITKDLTLPDGCDRWAIRTVYPDMRSKHGYRWPFPGQWAEAPGPLRTNNTDGCPDGVGDGICLAHTWRGMRSGGVPAITLLLCAYTSADVLGETTSEQKIRVRRAHVVDVVDGARLIREHGTRADLAGADLAGAYLAGAYLARAYLAGADLAGAYLAGAYLARAYLAGAYLARAYLAGAYLARADLAGADLARADLAGADLAGADLAGADLADADLAGADLRGAEYDRRTVWPGGLDPQARGAVLVGGAAR